MADLRVWALLHDRHHEMSGEPPAGHLLGVYATEAGAKAAQALLVRAGTDGRFSIVPAEVSHG